MTSTVARAAFRFRSSAPAGFVVRQAFAHASGMLPLRRVGETSHLLAFHHPVAGFSPVHLLLVPKLALASVIDLSDQQRELIAREVEQLAPECVEQLGRVHSPFLVIVNGGARQDVRQVHFHLLIDGYSLANAPVELSAGVWTDISDDAHDVHQVRTGRSPVHAGLMHATEMSGALQLPPRGYSIIWDARDRGSDGIVHLTAGMPAALP